MRAKRLYSLFEKRGWRYHRISQFAYTKPVAVHVFQDLLLTGGKSLRPVQDGFEDGRPVYRPPVEQLGPVRPALSDPAFIKSQLERSDRAPQLIPARSKSYRTREDT